VFVYYKAGVRRTHDYSFSTGLCSHALSQSEQACLFSPVYVCHLEFLPPKARVKCTLIHLQYCFKYSAVSYWA